MQLTLSKAYLGCQYLPFTQSVNEPDLWDQLGFLVTKILGSDYYSLFTLIKKQKIRVSLVFQYHTRVDAYLLRRRKREKGRSSVGKREGLLLLWISRIIGLSSKKRKP